MSEYEANLTYHFYLIYTAISTNITCGQDKKDIKDSTRYHLDSINGIYIPKDIYDAIQQIDSFWSDSIKTEVKKMSEGDFSARAHLGFGMWIRNNWGLWGGSRLLKYFNDMGVYDPDSMSGIIIHSYHRYLLGNEINSQEQIPQEQTAPITKQKEKPRNP